MPEGEAYSLHASYSAVSEDTLRVPPRVGRDTVTQKGEVLPQGRGHLQLKNWDSATDRKAVVSSGKLEGSSLVSLLA